MRKSYFKPDEFEAALADNLRAFERPFETNFDRSRARIFCLGESHGSHFFGLTRKVLPGTGSLLLRVPQSAGGDVIIDPGWGTIASARRLRVSLTDVDVILISHCHLDHVGDLHPLLLTLSLGGGRPLLVANSTTVNGGESQPSLLPDYFRRLCRQVVVGEPGKAISAQKTLKILPFATSHQENREAAGQSLGYILEIKPKRRIALITDGPLGSLDPSTLSRVRDCAAIIINLGTASISPHLPSHSKVFDNALCLYGLEGLLEDLAKKPNQIREVAVTHLGAELLEVRSKLMKRFLAQAGHRTVLSFLDSALRRLVIETLGKQVRARVLREGDELEV